MYIVRRCKRHDNTMIRTKLQKCQNRPAWHSVVQARVGIMWRSSLCSLRRLTTEEGAVSMLHRLNMDSTYCA